MMRICVIATGWGTQAGGINAFNTPWTTALANQPNVTVECILTTQPTTVETSVAIQVVDGRQSPNDIVDEIQRMYSERQRPDWWIGHDVYTGELASACRRGYELCCVVNHMDFKSYKVLEGSADANAKLARQRTVFGSADLVLAVGPKLANSVIDLTTAPISQLLPGYDDVAPSAQPTRFSVLVSGRLSHENDQLKQFRATVLAFADCVRSAALGDSPVLTLMGTDDTVVRDLRREADARANRACLLESHDFTGDRDAYNEVLRRQSVVVVSSLYEGFSLVGWEALCAGVPVVLSRNTGLWMFAQDMFPSAVLGVEILGKPYTGQTEEPPNEADVAELASALARGYRDRVALRGSADDARTVIAARFAWETSARATVSHLKTYSEERFYGAICADTGDERAAAVLVSPLSKFPELLAQLDAVRRSGVVGEQDSAALQTGDLAAVSDECLSRVVERWSDIEWELYCAAQERTPARAISSLVGIVLSGKQREMHTLYCEDSLAAAVGDAVREAVERTRRRRIPKTRIITPSQRLRRMVEGIASRVVGVYRSGDRPVWLRLLDPHLRVIVDTERERFVWRRETME